MTFLRKTNPCPSLCGPAQVFYPNKRVPVQWAEHTAKQGDNALKEEAMEEKGRGSQCIVKDKEK